MAASSRQRRSSKRARAGLSPTTKAPVNIVAQSTETPIWKHLGARLGFLFAVLTAFATFFVFWPWLSLDKSGTLDSSNPLRTLFFVQNEGFLPITHLGDMCLITAKGPTVEIRSPPVEQTDLTHYLPYKHKQNLYCERVINIGDAALDSASMVIEVRYSVLFIPIHRPQTFKLEGAKTAQNTWEWVYQE